MQHWTSGLRAVGSVATLTAVAILVPALLSCGANDSSAARPGRVRVGVLPDASVDTLLRKHGPLVEYLAAATGVETELVIPDSYDELVRDFEAGELHLAWFGGLTFLRAEESAHAEPLVMRNVDLEFTTDFLVARSAADGSVEDFAGKTLAFGPRLSTSGHIMPRYFLSLRGIESETFFGALRHSAGHEQTAGWVREGEVDIGAVNSVYSDSMFADGRLNPDEVGVLWRTPPYRNYVWALQPDLAASLRQDLLDAFLTLEAAVPEHAAILAAQGADGYVPASREDYTDLRRAADVVAGALRGDPPR